MELLCVAGAPVGVARDLLDGDQVGVVEPAEGLGLGRLDELAQEADGLCEQIDGAGEAHAALGGYAVKLTRRVAISSGV